MMLNPLFRRPRRGLLPLAQTERQVRQGDKIPNRILRSLLLVLSRSIQRMHDGIQQQPCLTLAHPGATPQRLITPVAIPPPHPYPPLKPSSLTLLPTTPLVPL